MNNLEIKNINIGQIHGYERNARNHPESQIKQIIKSITEFGFNNPILIDEHGEIIAGYGRYIAAKQMGLSTVPTITLSHLNEKQKRAYRLADNKIAENGGWNLELLQLEIKDLEQLVHRHMAEIKLGRPLQSGEVVHHINRNKQDNRPSNLFVFASQQAHWNAHKQDARDFGTDYSFKGKKN